LQIVGDRGQRLIDLMRKGRGDFTHGGET
jgi:hypothetical protein